MKLLFTKIILTIGGFLSIIGLFPIIGLYPSKMPGSIKKYLNYIFFNSNEFLWKLGLLILLLGIILSFILKFDNRMKILIFTVLALAVSFIAAFITVNRLINSAIIFLYPLSVILFIISIVYGLKSKIL